MPAGDFVRFWSMLWIAFSSRTVLVWQGVSGVVVTFWLTFRDKTRNLCFRVLPSAAQQHYMACVFYVVNSVTAAWWLASRVSVRELYISTTTPTGQTMEFQFTRCLVWHLLPSRQRPIRHLPDQSLSTAGISVVLFASIWSNIESVTVGKLIKLTKIHYCQGFRLSGNIREFGTANPRYFRQNFPRTVKPPLRLYNLVMKYRAFCCLHS